MSTRRPGPLRIAMFLRGMDGVFLPPATGVEPSLFLVEAGSPEEAWARALFGPEQTLPYRLSKSDLGPYPSTADLLRNSDVHAVLAANGVGAFFVQASCARATHAWARRHGIRLLMTGYLHQRRFEDKIWFDAFLAHHGLPKPRGGPATLGPGRRLPVPGPAVVQARDSMGGEGTYFVGGAADAARLVEEGVLVRGGRYLVRERIEGRAYGITVFVAPGRVALSAVRLQCYRRGPGARQVFAGIQWIPARALDDGLRRRIDETFSKLGALLYERTFFGFANFDFLVDERQRVFVIECNPRMSAATPQLLANPELLSGVSSGAVFLEELAKRRAFPRAAVRSRLPSSAFAGATLDIVHPSGESIIQREHASGLYALGDGGVAYRGPDLRRSGAGEVAVFSFARRGQTCRGEVTLASILSNDPLYDARGEPLESAERLRASFDYTS